MLLPAAELLQEGGWLMLLGMGIVFIFLIVLVFGLHVMSRLARWIEGKQRSSLAVTASEAASSPDQTADGELVAVVAAAVSRFRATRSWSAR
jgi:sodium pump decarboxylase gamma subunit